MAEKPARMGGASGYIMWAFAKTHQIYFLSATTTRSSLYETRSLHHWTSHHSGSRPHSARLTRHFSAARSAYSSWSMDSLPLSGVSLFRELLYKSKFLRRCCKCRTVFVTPAGLPCTPLTNTASVFHTWAPLWWRESLLSALTASFLFREQHCTSRPPTFFLPGTCEEKATGQRISALGDEWAYAGCTPAYLTLSPQRVFTRFLHPPKPASLCGYERSGLIRWKRWWRDGRQPVIGVFRCGGTVGFVPRPRRLAICAAQRIQPRHGRRSFPRPV